MSDSIEALEIRALKSQVLNLKDQVTYLNAQLAFENKRLREEFAVAAMQAMFLPDHHKEDRAKRFAEFAQMCWEVADAMVAHQSVRPVEEKPA